MGLTKLSILPSFQLWCWAPHSCAMSLVPSPFSVGGKLLQVEGLHVAGRVDAHARPVAELVEDRGAVGVSLRITSGSENPRTPDIVPK